MATINPQDRRRLAMNLIAEMAGLPGAERVATLEQFLADILGFTTIHGSIIAVDDAQLPGTAAVVGALSNEFGPDYTAVYFDLSSRGAARSHITNARVQAANRVVQRYAGEERYPLLVFALPDGSGIQFVTGDPSPTNRDRLEKVVRVTAYWESLNRTTLDCLERVGLAIASGEVPQRAFRDGFDVKPVTDEFFSAYKSAYDNAVELLTAGIERADAERFAQTLLNRLLFTHFVSKKDWLSINGSHDYLNALWRDYQAHGAETSFYLERLIPLFFNGFNNPQSQYLKRNDPVVHAAIGDVPFLNGGLFEPTSLDRQACQGVFSVPDEVIEPVLSDLFNSYNFTVMESTSLDTEVAVDPEMLGKLFEETVNERNGNGAYYTPRQVVEFMCREALKGYIVGKDITGLTESNVADLVDHRNPHAVTPQQALEIGNALASMKAVDPACGSGAFLLGMLQEILALNASLFIARHTSESLYRQKLDIISNSIYGTDKDGLAVSTAMLRLWLSLAVDYEGDGTPDPLPNLDLKLVVGDSIAGPDPRTLDFTHRWIETSTLHDDIVAYTTAQGQRKAELRERVEETKSRLRENMQDAASAGDIEWRIDFADVTARGGFDLVIGNPPYVQLQRSGGELANLYRSSGFATFARTGDLYQLFYERGCQLLKPDQGILAYITSNSWLKAEYGKTTRRYLCEMHTPFLLMEMGRNVFDEAIVDTCVLLLKQGYRGSHDSLEDLGIRAVDVERLDGGTFPPEAGLWGLARPKGDAPWSIMSATEQSIMDKMLAVGTPLKDWDIDINYGIKTGYNKAFIIDNQTKDALVAKDPKSAEIIKPVVRGRDIRRYRVAWAGLWLIDTHNGYEDTPAIDISHYPAVKSHLDNHYEQLAKRYDKGRTPYNLRNCAYHAEFVKEKLFWIDLTEEGRFAYDDSEMFCVNSAYMLTGDSLKYLCAVLNSTLVTWFMQNSALNSGMGTTRWVRFTVERIPIPIIDTAAQQPFIRVVDEIHHALRSGAEAESLESGLDGIVCDLYGLTTDEVQATNGR